RRHRLGRCRNPAQPHRPALAGPAFGARAPMKFALTDDQASVLNELERMLEGLPAHTEPVVAPYSDALDAALSESGFLDIAREDGFGTIDGTLLVERLARAPHIVEAAASAIVAPALGLEPGLRPLALVAGGPTRPA